MQHQQEAHRWKLGLASSGQVWRPQEVGRLGLVQVGECQRNAMKHDVKLSLLCTVLSFCSCLVSLCYNLFRELQEILRIESGLAKDCFCRVMFLYLHSDLPFFPYLTAHLKVNISSFEPNFCSSCQIPRMRSKEDHFRSELISFIPALSRDLLFPIQNPFLDTLIHFSVWFRNLELVTTNDLGIQIPQKVSITRLVGLLV